MSVRLLVCDDHPVVRAGLVALLDAEEGLDVVGQASDGQEAVAAAERLAPDVVLMDLGLPLLNGLEATRRIRALQPPPVVLILSMHDDGLTVRRASEAGASGYLVKGVDLGHIVAAVRSVASGERIFGPQVACGAVPAPALTSREREVLQLIGEGYTNRESGLLLNISPKTVEKHRASLMQKLDVHDTAALTRVAVALGIVHVPPSPEG